jgi:hypothetical protein
MEAAVKEMSETKVCDVTFLDGKVTLTNRRMHREAKSRKQNTLRKAKQRSRADVPQKSRPPSSSSTSLDSKESPKNDQQERVQRVLGVYPAVPPGRAASWLKDWANDDALIQALLDCREAGYLENPPNYVHQVLKTALRRGGRVLAKRSMPSKPSDYEAELESNYGWNQPKPTGKREIPAEHLEDR